MPDDMSDDYVGVDEDSSLNQRRVLGFVPHVVITILRWTFILLVVIGLMVLVSFIVNRAMNKSNQQNLLGGIVSPNTAVKPPKYQYFTFPEDIRARTADANPSMVIAKVILCFEKGDQETMNELVDRQSMLQDSIRHYFTTKRRVELNNEELIKRELNARLNQIMTTERIRDVLFHTFDVMEN